MGYIYQLASIISQKLKSRKNVILGINQLKKNPASGNPYVQAVCEVFYQAIYTKKAA